MKYLLIDTANIFWRSRHCAVKHSDTWSKVGMALHITLNSINAISRRFQYDHIVWCLEGKSWRKNIYTPYKNNRVLAKQKLTEEEIEEDKIFWNTYETLVNFLSEDTNCSVIQCPIAEGDDIVARWIHLHPQDEHTIISSDSDFIQLISHNVQQYNCIADQLITLSGVYDDRNNIVNDKKTDLPKVVDPEWALFEKIIRGDTSDNIFSAYPKVRTKSSKNKIGLMEAYEDRHIKGFAWNTIMQATWEDHHGAEHRVLDDYTRNKTLIDLTAQPDEIKNTIDTCIRTQLSHKQVDQVGIRFLKFCAKYELNSVSDNASEISKWLNKKYEGILNE